ncbi:GMC family oxidoreductase [Microbacterium aoyamense]|uniref:GMC family oxidoreductase n=1 Tax=Microbacterium aoyamense TaxID=344166 RepID=A0ABN2PTR0_9MICO|nr:GMC family oxidoreductase [Microbacterium aoyamense]
MAKKYDAIIVGMGASGGVLARELTRAGMKVLGLDKGHELEFDDTWKKFDELGWSSRAQHSPRMTTDPITWRDNDADEAVIAPWAVGPMLNPFCIPPSLGPGGGSWHYAAWHFRQAAEDFTMRSTITERFGKDALPEGSNIQDWPFGYKELEPYYERIEYEIGVSGKAGNINGAIDPRGNVFETPRRSEFAYPALRPGALYGKFKEGAESLGLHAYQTPTAIISRDTGERKACTYCGFCRDFLCHVGAKSSTHVQLIPDALRTGNLDMQLGVRVQKVNIGADGRAKGVSWITPEDGGEHEAEAPLVILAAYVLENVRLLLASGINDNGQTGKYYYMHNYDWSATLMEEDSLLYAGPAAAGGALDDYNAVNYDWSGTGIAWGGPFVLFNGDIQPTEGAGMQPGDEMRYGPQFKKWLTDGYRRMVGMVSIGVQFPMEQNYLDLDPTRKDPWGEPALRITHSWTKHELTYSSWIQPKLGEVLTAMGGTVAPWSLSMKPLHITTHDHGGHILGDDPARSVVDANLQSHQVPGLYALGGGSFPTVGGYNPTATIQALAFRLAEHLTSAQTGWSLWEDSSGRAA